MTPPLLNLLIFQNVLCNEDSNQVASNVYFHRKWFVSDNALMFDDNLEHLSRYLVYFFKSKLRAVLMPQ